MEILLNINGFATQARFDDACVEGMLLPLLRELTRQRRRLGRRMTVFLAAPPGAGKSTLAAFLERLSQQDGTLERVQALGLDGFHYHQDYLLTHTVRRNGEEIPMRSVKGAPETFDVEKLRRALADIQREDLRWPVYDRNRHDVIEDAVAVTAPVVIIEGNWLLLSDPEWASLPRDLSVFVSADKDVLRERLIARKIRGGASAEEAESFYEFSDGPNVRRCLSDSTRPDIGWRLRGDGSLAKRYRTVIFDLDGTLVDSAELLMAAFTAAVSELGYPPPPPGHRETILRGTNARAMAYLGLSDIQPVVDCLLKHLGRLRHLAGLYPGAEELVRGCAERGCRLGVVTSRCRREVDEDPALTGLLPLFDAIVTEEDTELHKPHPEPLRRCLSLLSAEASDALYLGDTPGDAACARGCGVDFAHAVWGASEAVEARYAPAAPEELLGELFR